MACFAETSGKGSGQGFDRVEIDCMFRGLRCGGGGWAVLHESCPSGDRRIDLVCAAQRGETYTVVGTAGALALNTLWTGAERK